MARGLGSVYRRGDIWWIKYIVRGRPHYESSKSTKEGEARRLLQKRLDEADKQRATTRQTRNCIVDDLVERVFRDQRINRRRSLKDTAVRNLIRLGISRGVAMKLTGHKTEEVFERYNITSMGDFAEAARRLDDAWTKRRGQ
ncbi:MAG: hypothetical protein E4H44_05545 [Candidatus Aminicenantes bacterium]|nr:MAG: hypothetical protein E4H44_05545 [Candidatus Aminicenantes bacterium]